MHTLSFCNSTFWLLPEVSRHPVNPRLFYWLTVSGMLGTNSRTRFSIFCLAVLVNALYFSATMRSSSVSDKIITVRNFILPNDHPRIIRCRFRRLHATWCWWASCSFVTNYFVFCFSLMFFTALDAWFRPEAKIMFGQRKWPSCVSCSGLLEVKFMAGLFDTHLGWLCAVHSHCTFCMRVCSHWRAHGLSYGGEHGKTCNA